MGGHFVTPASVLQSSAKIRARTKEQASEILKGYKARSGATLMMNFELISCSCMAGSWPRKFPLRPWRAPNRTVGPPRKGVCPRGARDDN